MKLMHYIEEFAATIRSMFLWFIHRKVAMILFVLFLLLIPSYVLYVNVFLPVKTAGKLVPMDQSTILKDDTAKVARHISKELEERIDQVAALELEKAFLKNRLDLAVKSDSVYMTLDLGDSLLNLEINGVAVRHCAVTGIRVSNRLSRIDHEQLLSWVSTPFNLEKDLSTIPKIPYVIKEAPKDTLEAQAQSAIPLPPDTTSVFFTLYFDRDLVVEIEQNIPPDDVDRAMINEYFSAKDRAYRAASRKAAFTFSPPKQEIILRLQVSPTDARAIYRGIPKNAMLAVKL